MNWNRIKTVTLYAWYHLNHSRETWMDLVWFPLVQTGIFGFLALYFAQSGNELQASAIIIGMVFWNVMEIGNYSLSVGMLWDVWSRSFSNLYIAPLKLQEFVVGQMIGGMGKSVMMLVVLGVIVKLVYGFSLMQLGWMIPVYYLLLIVFAFSVGVFAMGLIFRFGTLIQSIAWGAIHLFNPLSAAYYPLEILPASIQRISYMLPTTYVFEAIRSQLFTGTILTDHLVKAVLLDGVYFVLCYLFMRSMYVQAKKTGAFVRLEG